MLPDTQNRRVLFPTMRFFKLLQHIPHFKSFFEVIVLKTKGKFSELLCDVIYKWKDKEKVNHLIHVYSL
jgi:hypothetical protein